MRRVPLLIIIVALTGSKVSAQSEGITKAQGDEIIDQLRVIAQQLSANTSVSSSLSPRKPDVRQDTNNQLILGDAPFLGAANAPLVVVEFTDFECFFCQRFHAQTFGDLKKNYIDSGKIRYYSRDLPLDIHPSALRSAEAGQCAHEQGKFWAMHDQMQENPTKLDLDNLVSFATDLNLDAPKFRQCVASEKYKKAIQDGAREATEKGARAERPRFSLAAVRRRE
jgi:protein-disulfide isomerase